LNYALREKVSSSIRQAGSYVAPDRLRFDFNHYEALLEEQLAAIEELVNQCIMANSEVQTREMALKDVQNSDIIAVFDEKYGDVVRVLDIGGYSKELCGGTHAGRTGDLGLFRIVSESSVAAGIRRIEAVCGPVALKMARHERDMLRDLSRRFSITVDEIPERVESLVERSRKLEKELKQQAAEAALSNVDDLLKQQQDVDGVALIAESVGECSMDNLRGLMDALAPKLSSGVIVLGSANQGKACFMATVSKDLVEQGLHAGKLIGKVAKIAGGGGGGQPHKAQAGGKNAAKVDEAIQAVAGMLKG
jgi:alanyl-tRNA synthetase